MQILGPNCDPEKIRNPKSNRCVLKTGNIGRAILGIYKKQSVKLLRDARSKSKDKGDKESIKNKKKSVKSIKDKKDSVKLKDKDSIKDKKDSVKSIKDKKDSVKSIKDQKESVNVIKDKKDSVKSKEKEKKESVKAKDKEKTKSIKDSVKSKKSILDKNKIKIRKNECFPVGLKQITGTCWFNSIINGFILGDKTYKILLSKYNELSIKEKEQVTKIQDIASCPVHLKKLHFFQIFHKFLISEQGILNTNIKRGKNIPRRVIDNLDLRSTPNWHDKQPAYFVHLALPKLMPTIFDKDDFDIIETNSLQIGQTLTKKIVILQPINAYYSAIDSLTIPHQYVISHVGIVLMGKTIGHAITGYVCKNKYYIFDSETSNIIEADWRDPKVILGLYLKHSFTKTVFSYICLVRD